MNSCDLHEKTHSVLLDHIQRFIVKATLFRIIDDFMLFNMWICIRRHRRLINGIDGTSMIAV
jgi:hypothetical protein